MDELSFEEYLVKKKIDKDLFFKHLPAVFKDWETLFVHTHPESFTAQKKFFINKYRRQFIIKPIT